MESLIIRTTRTPSKICSKRYTISSLLQKCAFQSSATPRAETTFETPQTASGAKSHPRSEAAALLGLDSPTTSSRDTARMQDALRDSRARYAASQSAREKAALAARNNRNMERLSSRKWQIGDVYTPKDLTPLEIIQFRRKKQPSKDIFDSLGINPIDSYKNPVFLAEFMTSGGRIKHPSETGLRPVNQRKIAKAIRRAIGMGLMPKCHVHPEMLRRNGPDGQSRKYQWQ